MSWAVQPSTLFPEGILFDSERGASLTAGFLCIVGEIDLIVMSGHFINPLQPTSDERILFELEFGIEYPEQFLLDTLSYSEVYS